MNTGIRALACAALLLSAADAAAEWTPSAGVVLRGTIVTMTGEDAVIPDGRILVRDGLVLAVLGPGDPWPEGVDPGAAPEIETGGYIFPGLMNLHNHTAYNVLPLWEAPKLYSNRYQWTGPKEYSQLVNYPKKLLTDSNYFNMVVEVAKYAEVKGLVGGETAIQGTPSQNGIMNMLIRNVEATNFGRDRIFQRGLSIEDPRWIATLDPFKAKAATGAVDAWIVHLAEGVDEDPSAQEFDVLKTIGMLAEWTVVIHGTALDALDFAEMADAGAKLVWSPLSNMLLYGMTTRVDLAMAAGVTVSLATDWSPSGGKNLLDELKVAWELNKYFAATLEGYSPFDEYTLAKMVTVNPADTLHWTGEVGRIQAGLIADLFVIVPSTPGDPSAKTPYQHLVEATVRDVALVMVEGEPLYGSVPIMQATKGSDLEIVCSTAGFVKAIDVTREGPLKGEQTFAAIVQALQDAMTFDRATMRATFKQSVAEGWTQAQFDEWFDAKFTAAPVIPIPLDPLFVTDDPVWFQRVQASTNAAFPFDLQSLYYGFLGAGPTGPVTVGFPEADLLAFVNGASEATLAGDVGLPANDASAIAAYVATVGPFQTRAELVGATSVCTAVVIEAWLQAKTEPPPPPPPPDPPPIVGDEGALLAFLNHASTTFEVLDVDAGLNAKAASALVAWRNGPDGVFGTADDNLFDSTAEVDSVSYVGAATLAQLIAYAKTWVDQGGATTGSGSKLVAFLNHPSTTLEVLDIDVGLNKSAASALIAHRNGPDGIAGTADDDPFDDEAEVDAVPYVGPSALATLEAWAASWVEPDENAVVLAFVNDPQATLKVFDDDVGLTSLAAQSLIAHRDGPDGQPGTADDDLFDTLDELDAVPYIGPSALATLAAFAPQWAALPKGPPKVAVFLNHESTTLDALVATVGISSKAAVNLIAHRDGPDGILGTADDNPYDSEAEVDDVSQVGPVTLRALLDYAATWGAP